jgi:hypothetical protein
MKPSSSSIDNWFYKLAWVPKSYLTTHHTSDWATKKVALILQDDSGLAKTLMEALLRSGKRCVMVRAAERFQKINEGSYEINNQSGDDYSALQQSMVDDGLQPDGIFDLTNFGNGPFK